MLNHKNDNALSTVTVLVGAHLADGKQGFGVSELAFLPYNELGTITGFAVGRLVFECRYDDRADDMEDVVLAHLASGNYDTVVEVHLPHQWREMLPSKVIDEIKWDYDNAECIVVARHQRATQKPNARGEQGPDVGAIHVPLLMDIINGNDFWMNHRTR